MNSKPKLALAIIALIVIVSALSILATTPQITGAVLQNTFTNTTTNNPVRIVRTGYIKSIITFTPLFVAIENNIFQRNKIKLETSEFTSTKDLYDALVSDRIDFILIGGLPTVLAIENVNPGSTKSYGLAFDTQEKHLTYLLVKKNSNIQNISELRGKLGVPPGSNWKMWGAAIVKGYGLQGKIEIEQLKNDLLLPALETEQVQAIIVNEPLHAVGNYKNISRVLVAAPRNIVMDPAPLSQIITFSSKFVRENGKSAKAIALSIEEGLNYINKNESDAKRIYAKYAGFDVKMVSKATFPEMKLQLEEKDYAQAQALADFLYEEQELEKPIQVKPLFWQP
ncbi:MAG: ABC transporter substrate-binding protein [Candidatus Micrarchaeota archaeon]